MMLLPRSFRQEVGDRAAAAVVKENNGSKERRIMVIHWQHFLAACQAHGIPAEKDYK